MRKFRIISTVLILSFFSSCISSKKCTQIIDDFIKNKTKNYSTTKNNVSIQFKPDISKDTITKSIKVKSRFIPAIFYWGFENEILCNINKRELNKILTYKVNQILDSLNPNIKCDSLKILVDAPENRFVYHSEGQMFIIFNLIKSQDSKYILSKANQSLINLKGQCERSNIYLEYSKEFKSVLHKFKGTTNEIFIIQYLEKYFLNLDSFAKSIADLILISNQ